MRVFVNSYNRCTQNSAGGVQSKILDFFNILKEKNVNVKLYDKWRDKLSECDIVHYFSLSPEYFSEIQYVKGLGKKIVLSSVVPISGKNKIRLNVFAGKYLKLHSLLYCNKVILDCCDVIIAETSKEKQFIVDAYNINPSKIVVIPNGISPEILNGEAYLFRQKYKEENDFVIQVGRIDQNKNLLSVIKALNETGIPLYVIGGPVKGQERYYEECKIIAKDNVHFLGWIKHDDPLLKSALRAAKVLILPSFKEIFGNAIFEGLANGTNVVASNVLPVDEWGLGSVIETINPHDVVDIKEKILKALAKEGDKEVERKVLRDFSYEAITDKHIILYKNLMK